MTSTDEQTKPPSLFRAPNDAMAVFRFAMLGWYVGWYSKISMFIDEANIHLYYPLEHPSFTGFRVNGMVMFGALMVPMLFGLLLIKMSRLKLIIVALSTIICSVILLIHVASFNDATFTTSFWAGLWLLWLAGNCERNDYDLVRQGRRLALMTVSLMFLGGFIGKLTPEFWSGEMFYNYFFLSREILFYPWLRENLHPQQLRDLATWFSRFVVVMEGAMMLFWLLPFKRAAPLMIFCCSCIILGSTPWLISVFGCLIGMLLANYAWIDDGLEP